MARAGGWLRMGSRLRKIVFPAAALAAGLGLCGAAAAQSALDQLRIDALRAELAAQQQRDIVRQNEIMAAEARSRADDSVRRMQAPTATVLGLPGAVTPRTTPAPGMTAIPDAALARSQAQVEAAARRDR